MKFAIQHAIDVSATALARIAEFMISTGYAHESEPIQEKKMFQIQVSATKARPIVAVPESSTVNLYVIQRMKMYRNPEMALHTMRGPRRPSLSTSMTTANCDAMLGNPPAAPRRSVVSVEKPTFAKMRGA